MHPGRSRQCSELDLSVFLITLKAVYVVSADQPHLVAVFLQQRPQPKNVVPNHGMDAHKLLLWQRTRNSGIMRHRT